MILNKFANKYCVNTESDDSLSQLIVSEIDKLFTLNNFDERDLVAVDHLVKDHIKNNTGKAVSEK